MGDFNMTLSNLNLFDLITDRELRKLLSRPPHISFENEESCVLIKDHYGNETFALQPISKIDIPAKVIQNVADCYCEKPKDIFNKCLQEK